MRFAVSLLCAVPMALAGTVALLTLSTDSPASDFLEFGPRLAESIAVSTEGRSFASKQALVATVPQQNAQPSVQPLIIAQAPNNQASPSQTAPTQPQPVQQPLVQQSKSTPLPVGPSVVTAGTRQVGQTATAQGAASAKPMSRTELAQSLQRELRRVGCYAGEVTGEWSPASRQAMDSFLLHLNASLPTAEPDFILLTLLQGQIQPACNPSCPSGHIVEERGRCVPAPMLAQRTPKVAPPERALPAESAAANPASKSVETNAPWRTTVATPKATTRTPDGKMVEAPAAPSTKSPANVVTPAPIAGRMTIGAPMVDDSQALDGSAGVNGASSVVTGALSGANPGSKVWSSNAPKVQSPPAVKRVEPRERTAEAQRPRSQDKSWTKNFFER